MIKLSKQVRKKIIQRAIPESTKASLEDKDKRLAKFLDELAWYMTFGKLPSDNKE